MSKKNEAKAFREKYNLPAGGEKLDPNSCTCGKAGCQEHETWGEYLLKQIFTENETSPDVQITIDDFEPYLSKPEYHKDFLDVEKTAKNYDRRERAERKRIAAIEDPKARAAAGYNLWMVSRRGGEWWEFASLQHQQYHETAIVVEDNPVCVCGLIAKGDPNLNDDAVVQAARGHLDHPSKEVIKVFVINRMNEAKGHREVIIICQDCGDLEPPRVTEDDLVDPVHVREVRSAHVCKATLLSEQTF